MSVSSLLDFDHLYAQVVRPYFDSVQDHRKPNVSYSLTDVLGSSFAMFSLKSSSLLDFEQRTRVESSNILSVYDLRNVPSDTQVREVLDKVATSKLHGLFPRLFGALKESGVVNNYSFLNRLLVSIDGTGFFESGKVSCPYCLEKKLKNGTIRCSHSLLSAVLVHPDKTEVFPLANEPIARKDGDKKNDCERNAAKRLIKRLEDQYGDEKFLVVEDALYANVPHIEQITEAGMDYIIGVKPLGNKTLFSYFEEDKEADKTDKFVIKDKDGNQHTFQYANELRLNNSHQMKTNLVIYEYIPKKGKIQKGSWITSIEINQDNVMQIVKAAKSRWKIENETFNTLKNQGYGFDHNYGHGKEYLANNFALLMMVAFAVDQMQQAGSKIFKTARKGLKTKIKLWKSLQAVFQLVKVNSMSQIFEVIIEQYQVKEE